MRFSDWMRSTGFFKEIYDEISTGVLVIGTGGAGLRVAMEASNNDSNVLVVKSWVALTAQTGREAI